MLQNVTELYQYRVLLWSLTLRELSARYRGSALGFLWTFLNPTLLMLVYALLFSVYMRMDMENYTYFMFVGLLPWLWFATAVGTGATSVSDRRDLLTKVRFPPQVLPATVVLTHGINFLLSLPILAIAAVLFGVTPSPWALLLPVVWGIQLVLTLGLTYWISALTVTFRDLQHIVANLLTLLFFLTPILYPVTFIPERFRFFATMLNPMASFITIYQDILFYARPPEPRSVAICVLYAALFFTVGALIFARNRDDFAEMI